MEALLFQQAKSLQSRVIMKQPRKTRNQQHGIENNGKYVTKGSVICFANI